MTADGHVHDLVAVYALNALEPDEIEPFEAHLAVCDECRQAVAEAREVTDLLAYAAPSVPLPAGLRADLMRQLRAPTTNGQPIPIAAAPRWVRWWRPGLVAASLLIMVGLGAATLSTRQELNAERAQLQAERVQRQAEQAALQTVAPRATERANLVAMMVAPEATAIPLRAANATAAKANGRLVIDHQQHSLMLIVRALPPLPDRQVYQVWLSYGTVRTPMRTFRVDGEGSAMVPLTMPDDLAAYRWLWVTVEPTPGSQEPTTEPLLAAAL
jgi:anti-sigma factor RsiW